MAVTSSAFAVGLDLGLQVLVGSLGGLEISNKPGELTSLGLNLVLVGLHRLGSRLVEVLEGRGGHCVELLHLGDLLLDGIGVFVKLTVHLVDPFQSSEVGALRGHDVLLLLSHGVDGLIKFVGKLSLKCILVVLLDLGLNPHHSQVLLLTDIVVDGSRLGFSRPSEEEGEFIGVHLRHRFHASPVGETSDFTSDGRATGLSLVSSGNCSLAPLDKSVTLFLGLTLDEGSLIQVDEVGLVRVSIIMMVFVDLLLNLSEAYTFPVEVLNFLLNGGLLDLLFYHGSS